MRLSLASLEMDTTSCITRYGCTVSATNHQAGAGAPPIRRALPSIGIHTSTFSFDHASSCPRHGCPWRIALVSSCGWVGTVLVDLHQSDHHSVEVESHREICCRRSKADGSRARGRDIRGANVAAWASEERGGGRNGALALWRRWKVTRVRCRWGRRPPERTKLDVAAVDLVGKVVRLPKEEVHVARETTQW